MEVGDKYKTFENRREAAEVLIPLLLDLKDENPLIVAIPRGAVPMAQLVAQSLQAPMDIALVKKISHPLYPEFAIGAVSESGEVYLTNEAQSLDSRQIEESALKEVENLQKRRSQYTGYERFHYPSGRTVVVIDDGIATGATMIAAIRTLRSQGARRIIVAAPVASQQALQQLQEEGAETRIYYIPRYFGSVSYFYREFDQVSDAEMGDYFQIRSYEVEIPASHQNRRIKATVGKPSLVHGVVVFAHGSGKGRLNPRDQFVADILNHQGMATVLADLQVEEDSRLDDKTSHVDLMAQRLLLLINWIQFQSDFTNVPFGIYGVGAGAASALIAAAKISDRIQAVVCRSGRPDLALSALAEVHCPVLLIVGANDPAVIELNQMAFDKLQTEKQFEIIPNATHAFEEPGALEAVVDKSFKWFKKCFNRNKIFDMRFAPPLYP